MLADREQVNQGMADRGRQANQEDYLNLVQSYKTPEELQAARMSGVLDQRLASLDPRNQAAVRGATEARISSLQTQATAGNTFATSQKDFADKPLIEQHALYVALGQNDAAQELRIANPAVNWAASAQSAYTTGLSRGNDARVTELAVKGQPGKLDAIDQADAMAKIQNPLEQARAVAAGVIQPTVLANNALKVKEENSVLTDTVQGRALDTELGAMQATYLKDRSEQGRAMGAMATQLGLPVDAAGFPKFQEMGEVARKKFDDFAAARNSPLSATFMKGDTQAANAFIDQLTRSGKYSPELLSKRRDSILSGFNTNTLRDQTGNDKFNSKLATARDDVANAAKFDKDYYPAGSPAAAAGFEALQKEVPNLIDMTSGNSPLEDVRSMQEFVASVAQRGIEYETGKFITPSVQDVRDVIRSAPGGWFSDKARAGDALELLRVKVKSKEGLAKIKGAEEADAYRKEQQVKALMSSLPPPVTK